MGRGPLWAGGPYGQGALMGRGPLWAGGPYGQGAFMGRGPLWAGGLYGQGAFMGRGPLWAGGPYGQGAFMGRGPLWAGGPYGQGAFMGRGPLWAGGLYGQGAFMGRGPLWAGGPYGPLHRPQSLLLDSSLGADSCTESFVVRVIPKSFAAKLVLLSFIPTYAKVAEWNSSKIAFRPHRLPQGRHCCHCDTLRSGGRFGSSLKRITSQSRTSRVPVTQWCARTQVNCFCSLLRSRSSEASAANVSVFAESLQEIGYPGKWAGPSATVLKEALLASERQLTGGSHEETISCFAFPVRGLVAPEWRTAHSSAQFPSPLRKESEFIWRQRRCWGRDEREGVGRTKTSRPSPSRTPRRSRTLGRYDPSLSGCLGSALTSMQTRTKAKEPRLDYFTRLGS